MERYWREVVTAGSRKLAEVDLGVSLDFFVDDILDRSLATDFGQQFGGDAGAKAVDVLNTMLKS